MSKKNILVLTGSPRKHGNSDLLANSFIKGAKTAGHEVVKYEAGLMEIRGCKACGTCWSMGRPCTFEDDFDALAPMLEEADTIVFCTPLYWFSFSSQIKAAIDKMYVYIGKKSKRPLNIKESLLFVCAADDEISVFDGVKATYREIVHYMKWQDKGMLLVPSVGEKGEIEKTDALEKAEAFGKSI